MAPDAYKRQAALLLSVLPEVAKETCFALHGGTAINLFARNMPRLSVDIDLTYVPIEDRPTSLTNIADALERIKSRVEKVVPKARVSHRKDVAKRLISAQGVDIKLEVNLVSRGTIHIPDPLRLCAKAQDEFEAFCAIQVVPFGQLYGGKICAALDRQHPRDLFDMKYLLANEGFSDDVRKGFLLSLLSSDRPMHEIINPNFLDQRSVLENQFAGMSEEAFTYEEFEQVRASLDKTIHEKLTAEDRRFLLSIKDVAPDWSIHDFERFPAVAWKLQNLRKLKEVAPGKHRSQYEALKRKLGGN
jgi:predicted nucleotidyltransferase component of viral defense system